MDLLLVLWLSSVMSVAKAGTDGGHAGRRYRGEDCRLCFDPYQELGVQPHSDIAICQQAHKKILRSRTDVSSNPAAQKWNADQALHLCTEDHKGRSSIAKNLVGDTAWWNTFQQAKPSTLLFVVISLLVVTGLASLVMKRYQTQLLLVEVSGRSLNKTHDLSRRSINVPETPDEEKEGFDASTIAGDEQLVIPESRRSSLETDGSNDSTFDSISDMPVFHMTISDTINVTVDDVVHPHRIRIRGLPEEPGVIVSGRNGCHCGEKPEESLEGRKRSEGCISGDDSSKENEDDDSFEISLITAVAKNRKPGNVRKAASGKVTIGDVVLDGVYFSKPGRCDFYLAKAHLHSFNLRKLAYEWKAECELPNPGAANTFKALWQFKRGGWPCKLTETGKAFKKQLGDEVWKTKMEKLKQGACGCQN